MNAIAALRAQERYREEAILSATPERLVTMLFDRLVLDVERGEAAQIRGDWAEANSELQHAQSVLAHLTSTLTDAWDGSPGLRALYGFLNTTLISANIARDPERVRACGALIAPLRDAWHAAADRVAVAPER